MAAAREKHANGRIRLLLALFALAFAALFVRGTWIQGVQAGRLAKLAHGQHQKSFKIPAGRGPVYDRTGVQLALGEQTITIYADPKQVLNASAVPIAAHRLLGVDPNSLYPALRGKRSHFVYLNGFAEPADAERFVTKHC